MPNSTRITASLKASLAEDFFSLLTRAGEFCHKRGERLFVAGGIVRDLLIDIQSKDIDLVVEGDSHALADEIARLYNAKITLHQRFQTAKLSVNGFTVDIAIARKETYDHPGALPKITAGTMEDDLKRRDFSINAMAVSISGDTYGHLVDPLGGYADLKAGIIRILHPESFSDDPTRIFRAIRYEQRFGFEIEPETLTLLQEAKKHIPALSADRLRYEFECILDEQAPEKALCRASRLSVLKAVSEKLVFDMTSAGWFKSVRENNSLESPLPSLYLASWIGGMADSDAQRLAARLNLSADSRKTVGDISKLKKRLINLRLPGLLPADICRILDSITPVAIEAFTVISPDSMVKERLRMYLASLRHIRPILGGDELIELGYSPGPDIGKALQKIKNARLNGVVSTRKQEIEMAKNLLGRSSP
ncbi:MAG: hypothetical protein WCS74_00095 [Dehalococcoidales bacterium]|nr:hypothetical protein [Dehalococcoidales bacterium]MDD3264461.1 hypothetical protein [Dehalococcoidales bacterium]MDD4322462.1 hypothetical protein [Dehalococcoidales bacterium]MDD4793982.1 hypothetical protein [Dehalococcoidales bacterium]MDD5498350.1 hypothetical protein [Dehalococcoidales bacterium]